MMLQLLVVAPWALQAFGCTGTIVFAAVQDAFVKALDTEHVNVFDPAAPKVEHSVPDFWVVLHVFPAPSFATEQEPLAVEFAALMAVHWAPDVTGAGLPDDDPVLHVLPSAPTPSAAEQLEVVAFGCCDAYIEHLIACTTPLTVGAPPALQALLAFPGPPGPPPAPLQAVGLAFPPALAEQ